MPTNNPQTDVEDLAGLDALDTPIAPAPSPLRRLWSATWPQAAAVGLALAIWQFVVWIGWKPPDLLPGPGSTFRRLATNITDMSLLHATATTMRRAIVGYAAALAVGTSLGLIVSRSRLVRTAIGSLITGLQTMPTISWFPLALLLFSTSETAILFVVVLSAAPAIANGLISGVDHIEPTLLRAGRVLGARGLAAYRHVVLPAALPGFVGGMKQGWAFSWRSLLSAELLVAIGTHRSLGVDLQQARESGDASRLLATMIAILLIGIIIDSLVFARVERTIRRRWGLATQ